MADTTKFFKQLASLPLEINRKIWADYFRLAAEDHANNFAAVHDEMTNYSLRVNIADKIKLTLCNANTYYSIVDIDDLWLNAYIFKHVLEIQIKIDCLRLLGEYKWRKMNQPTVRFGDVIVHIEDGLYNCTIASTGSNTSTGINASGTGRTLNYYLGQIPGIRDYMEDRLAYERRFRQIEWLTYVDDCWLEMGLENNGNSIVGRGVSGLGFGTDGFDSGQIGASDNESSGIGDESDDESWRNWVPSDDELDDDASSTGTTTGASGGEETGAGGLTG